ncbi:MAG TPA: glycogen debranching protein GlgX [Xanthobacteraceae bacterium]|nr:glycogen debranching protein GlgX [Xanthobacteraceae bacterium]
MSVSNGRPEPLGVSADATGANVAVVSAHAEAVELCLFDSDDTETARLELPARTGDVFHGRVAGLAPGQRYGLRARGPFDPGHGHRFNPAKLLVDPYAAELDRPFVLHPAQFDRRAYGDATDETDSAPFVPKALVQLPDLPPIPARPVFDWGDQVIYELHVRGFTRLHPGVPEALRGTFAGLAHPAALEHLVQLGITTVELMPAMAWIDERHLPPLGLSNYWGYNPVVFGAPDPRLAPGGFAEVRAAVAALHAAGLSVILDVVLNHSGESDALGPTLSLRGLDNALYYRHAMGDPGLLINDAGTGNTLALERPPVLRLALDSLRAWAATGIDGFRFDLAATLGRRPKGFDPAAPFFAAIGQDPALRDLALIAEPWDIGPGGYQVGNFPAPWGEWNDHFRDTARRFWRGDGHKLGEMATRLAGSADVLAPRRRPLSRGINFIAAHDGFTLADLVSYEHKHNLANGEDNRDGTNDNHSWNNGTEGPTDDPAVTARRQADMRALLAILLAARGTPMLTMGDECGRSQAGNNNAYAQDNALTWLDWAGMDQDLAAFTGQLVRLRRSHPALRRDVPLTGTPIDASALPDVEWRAADGGPPAWDAPEVRTLVAVLYAPAEGGAAADRVAVALHAGHDPAELLLPAPRDGFAWQVGACSAASLPVMEGDRCALAPRTVLIAVEVPAADAPRRPADPALLDRLAGAAGIALDWWDVGGTYHRVSDDTKRVLLAALRLPAGSGGEARDSLVRLSEEHFEGLLPPALVVRAGDPVRLRLGGAAGRAVARLALDLVLEDGEARTLPVGAGDGERTEVLRPDGRRAVLRHVALPPLPIGRHRLRLGQEECRLTIAPPACYLPAELEQGGRLFGVSAHLYTLRRAALDQGIGDFSALATLAEAAGAAGASTLGLNPLHALFPHDRERASPYHPCDRRFLDPIYIDLAALGAGSPNFAALAAGPTVDYSGVWAEKRVRLEAAFAAFEGQGDVAFDAFIAKGGAALAGFATFQAIAETYPRWSWRDWPQELRRPDGPGVAAFAAEHARAVRFAQWQQWVADVQFGQAAARGRAAGLSLGFYRDLAVGTAPDGSEAWAEADLLMQGVSVGAPPDPLGPEGQNWSLPPPDPLALARDGYAGFARLVAANMRHAGALRIDHVMGLRRLFLLPEGAKAADGAYLAMPFADLAGQVALESVRARCLVVGEDLGTVPEGMRGELEERRLLSYRVLWFERSAEDFLPPAAFPALAAACVSTHDLPTLVGWWGGFDIEERAALGFDDAPVTQAAHAARRAEKLRLLAALRAEGLFTEAPDPDAPMPEALLPAVHAYMARTPSVLALAQLDDLAGETSAVNLPGTDRERPNWRRRLSKPVETVLTDPSAQAVLAAMRAERG